MPFNTFCGEFLVHPAGLDYSGNTCSHNCAYCFANLNEPLRRSDFKASLNFVASAGKKSSFAKILFDAGVPICFSNKSDPLSDSNVAQTFGLWQVLKDKPNGIFWQTKGGKLQDKWVDAIAGRQRQAVYITITTTRDEIQRKLEPNSAPPRERIRLAKRLIEAGIPVFIGTNPLHPDWFPIDEFVDFALEMQEIGVSGFVMRAPYILKAWINNGRFNEKRRAGMCGVEPESLLEKSNDAVQYVSAWAETLMDDGFPVDRGFYGAEISARFRDALGEMAFPAGHTFYKKAIDAPAGTEFTFDDFFDALVPAENKPLRALFTQEFSQTLDTYTFALARSAYLKRKKSVFSFRELLRNIYHDSRFFFSPANFYFLQKTDAGTYIRTAETQKIYC